LNPQYRLLVFVQCGKTLIDMTAGKPQLAFWLESPNFAACEIARMIGFDTVVLDMEHGTIGVESADCVIARCRAAGLRCYSRVAAAERVPVQQALDSGADGVILPQIVDYAHANIAAAYAKFPPLGQRGVGFSRIMDYGINRTIGDEFFAEENARTTCLPMVETPGALRDIEAILALKTVDGLFIGPSDLSMTCGRGSFKFSVEDKQAFSTVAAATRKAGKILGLPATTAEAYSFALAEGATLVTLSDDLTALHIGLAESLRRTCATK
jgi:2-keto-3-deoxy-L-rhamnonate aldolase RhmA